MSDKKHIDRIFQEKLKDFEATPSPKVWQHIQSEIEQPNKETKKVYPIWIRLAGIAALLLLLFTIGNTIFSNDGNATKTNVVNTENDKNESKTETNNQNTTNLKLAEENTNTPKDNNTSQDNVIANTSSSEEGSNNNSQSSDSLSTVSNNNTNGVASTNVSERKTSVNNNPSASNSWANNNNSVSNKISNKNQITTSTSSPNVIAKKETPIYSNSSERITSTNSKNSNTENGATNNNSNTSEIGVVQNNSERINNESLPQLDTEKIDAALKSNNSDALVENQNNTDEVAKEEGKTTDEEIKEDTPSIEEEIAQAENINEEEKEEKVNRWQVYANIAPVYYNTLGKGSHIDEQFDNSSKTGEINASYGVNVSYAFNDKLKLRSGIHSLKLSYDTDDVILFENVSVISGGGAPLRNLSLNSTGQNISAISSTNLTAQQAVGLLPNENAAISQRLGYYEVPLELEYTLVNKKFGVNVIGGVSTFILNDNEVYSEFDGYNTHIGEANNVNDVSFSGNLGLGLDYKFSDKIKFNVQPTFKYQLNAYKNTSGSFRPYIVGVYTGLSYKF